MLDLNKSQLIETRVVDLHSGVTSFEEGMAFVQDHENGLSVAKLSTATATEAFLGVALERPAAPTVVPYVELLTIPSSSAYTVTLSKTMSGSDIGVTVIAANGTRTVLTAGTPGSNATEYSISNGVITVHADQAGLTLEVVYKYAITLQEAILKFNFDSQFSTSKGVHGTVSLVTTGLVYTSNYDVTKNWHSISASTPIKVGAGGVFTIGGNGVSLDALVEEVPSVASNGMLGIRLHP